METDPIETDFTSFGKLFTGFWKIRYLRLLVILVVVVYVPVIGIAWGCACLGLQLGLFDLLIAVGVLAPIALSLSLFSLAGDLTGLRAGSREACSISCRKYLRMLAAEGLFILTIISPLYTASFLNSLVEVEGIARYDRRLYASIPHSMLFQEYGLSLAAATAVAVSVWLMTTFGLVVPSMIFENLGLRDSLARSRRLTSGRRWEFAALMSIGLFAGLVFQKSIVIPARFLPQSSLTTLPAILILVTLPGVLLLVILGLFYFHALESQEAGGEDLSDRGIFLPHEPWARTLRRMGGVVAGLLILSSLALMTGSAGTKMQWILLVSGLASLAIFAAPLGMTTRGILAAATGILPILFLSGGGIDANVIPMNQNAPPASLDWRSFSLLLGLLAVCSGLLVRSRYPASCSGPVLSSAGALSILSIYLVPFHGGILLTDHLVGLFQPWPVPPIALLTLAPISLAITGLAGWLPPDHEIGESGWIWIGFLFPGTLIVSACFMLLFRIVPGGPSLSDFPLTIPLVVAIASTAWFALASHGIAAVIGKILEI